ncbi:hypothetical protein B0H17DRAFT_1131345 [Mycena rosella]|uniref:Uncharacterized protein n=1 Tax=Mycena rosella TaxID=1033263 RepID=A0AAD7DNT0_MYCRO|nr:hypothetical protein B0H17DRAFT_1131345 [Mycena rosella]
MLALQPRFLLLLGLCLVASSTAVSLPSAQDVSLAVYSCSPWLIYLAQTVHVAPGAGAFPANDHAHVKPRAGPALPEVPKVPSLPPKMVKRAGLAPTPHVESKSDLVPVSLKDKRGAPAVPALPATPALPALPKLPVPNKRDTPGAPALPAAPALPSLPKLPVRDVPAAPALPVKLPLPKRDETDPAVLFSKVPRSDDIPEPVEHAPVIRPHFSRSLTSALAPATDVIDTVWNSETGENVGNDQTGSKDTVINPPDLVKLADKNPAPLAQTNEQDHQDGYKSTDFALAGTTPASKGQTLHDHAETLSSGKKLEDMEIAGGIVHKHTETQRRQEDDDEYEEEVSPDVHHAHHMSADVKRSSDQVIEAPVVGEAYHEHEETKRDHYWNHHHHHHPEHHSHSHTHVHEHNY